MDKAVRLRVNVGASFPTQVVGANGVGVAKQNGIYTIANNYSSLAAIGSIPTPANKQVVVYDTTTGQYNTVPTSALPGSSGGTGNVTGPLSSVDGDVAVFSGTSGTVIRDGGKRRIMLAAPTSFYVNPSTGNDSNSGLSPPQAFATIQKAYDTITGTLDLGGQTVTIQLADGTYTVGLSVAAPWTGGGQIQIIGNTITPSNVFIHVATGHCFNITSLVPSPLTIDGMKLQSDTGNLIQNTGIGTITFGTAIQFGSASQAHLWGQGAAALIQNVGSYSIVGGAGWHMRALFQGAIRTNSGTATLVGTPAFVVAFGEANIAGILNAQAMTFSGSATGSRFNIAAGGSIYTGGAGPNYFPGNSAGTGGTTAGGGFYT